MAAITQKLVKQVSENNDLEKPDSEFALRYLEYYYVQNKTTALAATDISTLVKQFQRTFGLKVNGKLDNQTIRAMHWPRCGCPDYKMMKSEAQASKWGPKQLTYYVEKYVNGVSKADQDDILDLAFQQWEDHCELNISRVTSNNKANMILSTGSGRADNFDGPGGTLAWAYLPPNNNYNGQLLMRFDLGETWITNPRDRGILLLNVACHEFGHLLGLDHSKVQRALMAPYYSAGITKPQDSDDIPRIQSLYGIRTSPVPGGPTQPPPPENDKHTITITNISLDQVQIDGKATTDFSLI